MLGQVQCPHCGAQNRAGAKFCANCRARLAVAAGSKACPQCHIANRADAKFCAACRHRFSDAPIVPSTLIFASVGVAGAIVVLLVCGLLIWATRTLSSPIVSASATPTSFPIVSASATPTSFVMATSASSPAAGASELPTLPHVPGFTPTSVAISAPTIATVAGLERAEHATVLIMVPMDSRPSYFSGGSGTVVTQRGHILTNYHIFVDDSGKPENARGEIYIAVPPAANLKEKAQIRYRARMIQADSKNDLALIQISATSDNRALPADLGLAVAPIGDSDALAIGDAVFVLGYPGLGGESLTFTRGVVSGFLIDEGFIKTDAEINQGNSGGGAYNALYQLIGVPSMTVSARQTTGKLGLIRPIKTAQPLLNLARREAGE